MNLLLLLYVILAGLLALLVGELNWYWVLATIIGVLLGIFL